MQNAKYMHGPFIEIAQARISNSNSIETKAESVKKLFSAVVVFAVFSSIEATAAKPVACQSPGSGGTAYMCVGASGTARTAVLAYCKSHDENPKICANPGDDCENAADASTVMAIPAVGYCKRMVPGVDSPNTVGGIVSFKKKKEKHNLPVDDRPSTPNRGCWLIPGYPNSCG